MSYQGLIEKARHADVLCGKYRRERPDSRLHHKWRTRMWRTMRQLERAMKLNHR